jgi:XRE family transcriptional regulator, regulator of sulfur utilization
MVCAMPAVQARADMVEKSGYFADRLKQLRHAAGMSQADLAKSSGVPVTTIHGFEQGRREPGFVTLLRLAKGLGVSLAAFEPDEQTKKRKK